MSCVPHERGMVGIPGADSSELCKNPAQCASKKEGGTHSPVEQNAVPGW